MIAANDSRLDTSVQHRQELDAKMIKVDVSSKRNSPAARALLTVLAMAIVALAVLPSGAQAAPEWRIAAYGNSTVAPGAMFNYQVQLNQVGDSVAACPGPSCTLEMEFPAGVTPLFAPLDSGFSSCVGMGTPGPVTVTCSSPAAGSWSAFDSQTLWVLASIAPSATPGSRLVSQFAIYGPTSNGAVRRDGTPCDAAPPGLPCAETAQVVTVDPDPPSFGVDAFDGRVSANESGDPYTRAAGVPYSASVAFDLVTESDGRYPPVPTLTDNFPVEPVKDVVVDLPPGLVGSTRGVPQCTLGELAVVTGTNLGSTPTCRPASQLGYVDVEVGSQRLPDVPIFNMVPPDDAPARFGFGLLGTTVVLDGRVRSESDFGVTIETRYTSQGIPVTGSRAELWGVPADPSHDSLRACPGYGPPSWGGVRALDPACLDTSGDPYYERPEPAAFLRNPSSCTGPVETTARISSWEHSGVRLEDGSIDTSDPNWKTASFTSHNPPGYPLPPESWGSAQGVTDCNAVPFNPQVSVEPTSTEADSPTGIDVRISVPQPSDPSILGSSDLKGAEVSLPEGFTVNPGGAGGLAACSLAEIDLGGRNTEAKCPNASKIGSVEIETPLLDDVLEGSVFLAEQNDPGTSAPENPFDALLAIYIVAEGPGTIIKLPGKVELDESTGQVVSTFSDQPQLPFSTLHVSFFDGQRSPIATPTTCGTGVATSELTPWARPSGSVIRTSTVEISSGPNGQPCSAVEADRPFSPAMTAGLRDAVASSPSPFTLKLARADGHQELSALDVTMPEGLTAKLAGVDQCSDGALASISGVEGTGAAENESPACPANSQVGVATVGAGPGSSPYYVSTGKAYLAGPYKGAPLSLAVVVPALAGPFDLGTTVVRNKLNVDPRTAQVSVESDPLPQILHGIPLRLRDVRVNINRPDFMIAPSNCNPMQIEAHVTGSDGKTADLTNRFQVGGCSSLGFSPKLKLDFGKKKKDTKPNAHPPLNAKLAFNEGDANISYVEVALPQGILLDQERLGRICSRANYAAETCPEESRVGYAKATTPLLDDPVEGPVYLKASDNPLPDLAADLNGQIDVDLFGKIDQKQNKKGLNQIRNTFDVVPDVPVSSFELTLDGGNDGLLVNSRNICKSKSAQKLSIEMTAHNEMSLSEKPLIGSACKQINKQKAKQLNKQASKLLAKAKKTKNKKKAKKLRKQAKRLKQQAKKLGR